MTKRLYGYADIARALGVTRPSVTQWHTRDNVEPPPAPHFVTTTGAPYWESLDEWFEWNERRLSNPRVSRDIQIKQLRKARDRLTRRIHTLEAKQNGVTHDRNNHEHRSDRGTGIEVHHQHDDATVDAPRRRDAG
ncbi:hypothetical protein SEA_KABOCHA_77 [Gordonia phage Kabocha]|nr:hypothetical protein SEA_KABOCHA_77 [Gordonia phage Kabocha]WAA20052.1 hypothetical protein SEA_HANEM_75 [Gordonia phage Hanem]WNM67095.1 helix-turn-helix DNA binding domain protein [Gordonia Phage Schomber]